jgi:hypothetical protein
VRSTLVRAQRARWKTAAEDLVVEVDCRRVLSIFGMEVGDGMVAP